VHLLVPLELCFYALRNKRTRALQLLLYLKIKYNTAFSLEPTKREQIAADLGLGSERTIRNQLRTLLQLNWIGFDKARHIYIIRGFKRIQRDLKMERTTGVVFSKYEILRFKAFACGAVISSLVQAQKRKKWLDARKSGRAIPSGHSSLDYFEVANEAIAKVLECSTSTASLYKKAAQEAGYISVKRNYHPTGVAKSEKKNYLLGRPELVCKARVLDGLVFLQEPDLVKGHILFRSRKKTY
jgi:hypothetical protein